MEDGRCEGEKRFGDVTISKSGLAWAGASSGGLRLGISIRQAGSSFAPWPSAEAIRELFAIPSGGGRVNAWMALRPVGSLRAFARGRESEQGGKNNGGVRSRKGKADSAVQKGKEIEK
jgi:hypothetical protein